MSWNLRGARWQWRANDDWQFLLGGAVFAYGQPSQRLSQHFLFVAAGPVATGLLWYVCAAGPDGRAHPRARQLPRDQPVLALATLIFNLIPMRLGAMTSDGWQLLQLLKRV